MEPKWQTLRVLESARFKISSRYAVNLIDKVALWHLVEKEWLIYFVWHQYSIKVIQFFARKWAMEKIACCSVHVPSCISQKLNKLI